MTAFVGGAMPQIVRARRLDSSFLCPARPFRSQSFSSGTRTLTQRKVTSCGPPPTAPPPIPDSPPEHADAVSRPRAAEPSPSGKQQKHQRVSAQNSPVPGELVVARNSSVEDDAKTQLHRRSPKFSWDYIWPRALVLGTAVLWSSNFICVRSLSGGDVSAADAAFARFSLAALALAPSFFIGPRLADDSSRREEPLPAGILPAGISCGLWAAMGYVTQAVSLQTTGAGKAAFICSLAVVFVPFVTMVIPSLEVGNKQSRPSLMAAVLATAGVGVMELGGASSGVQSGDFWALGQMVGFGLGFIQNERALSRYPRHILQLAALQLAVVAVVSAIWATGDACISAHSIAFPDMLSAFGVHAGLAATASIFYTGLVTTAATIWLENIALLHVSASEMSLILTTEPLFASALAATFLKEPVGSEAALGGGLILLAVFASQIKNQSSRTNGNVLRGFGAKARKWLTRSRS